MKITKENKCNNSIRKVTLEDTDKVLELSVLETLDVFFIFFSKGDKKFEITKENKEIYNSFLNLYNKIKNNELFEVDNDALENAKTKEEKDYIREHNKEMNEYQKRKSNYYDLFHNDTITWVSDRYSDSEINDEVAIVKEDDKFVLNFSKQVTTVVFDSANSYYKPYNLLFAELLTNVIKSNPIIEEKNEEIKRIRK